LHRAIGASDPRLPAGQLIQPQRRASESVTVPWAQECAFNYDVRLKGQFCKIVGGEAQGYRISDLSEDFGEICVLPSRPLDLDAQGAL
jgi:hypothetical protein